MCLLHRRLQNSFAGSTKAQNEFRDPSDWIVLGEQGRSEVGNCSVDSRWRDRREFPPHACFIGRYLPPEGTVGGSRTGVPEGACPRTPKQKCESRPSNSAFFAPKERGGVRDRP